MILSEGNNIKLTKVGDDYLITGMTTVQNKEFKLTAESIELVGERGVMINSAMPNKIIISVDMNKLLAEMADLQKRFEALETVVLGMVKKGS